MSASTDNGTTGVVLSVLFFLLAAKTSKEHGDKLVEIDGRLVEISMNGLIDHAVDNSQSARIDTIEATLQDLSATLAPPELVIVPKYVVLVQNGSAVSAADNSVVPSWSTTQGSLRFDSAANTDFKVDAGYTHVRYSGSVNGTAPFAGAHSFALLEVGESGELRAVASNTATNQLNTTMSVGSNWVPIDARKSLRFSGQYYVGSNLHQGNLTLEFAKLS